MPGTCTSIEYCALPLTLCGSSARITSLVIKGGSLLGFFKSSGLICWRLRRNFGKRHNFNVGQFAALICCAPPRSVRWLIHPLKR